MDNRPGRIMNSSKLTDKYIAGRGRALKDFARRSPKAEEVEKRKQIQQLILSGKIFLDKEMIEKHFNAGKNGSRSGSASSSLSQLQLEDGEEDSLLDLTSENRCSKAPVGCSQLQEQVQTEAINNNLENHVQNLKSLDKNKNENNDRIPPRFRNSQWGKNFKKQANKPWVNKQKPNNNKRPLKVEETGGESLGDQLKLQEPTATWSGTQNQATGLNPWHEWEDSVVVHEPIHDEDLEDIVVVDDNDNLDDVMVQQYVNALHQETNGTAEKSATSSKVTPSLIQGLGNLKSTTNADSYKVPVGTIPNPPKGPDRWGGSELKDIEQPTGWGDIVEDSGNWYDDGSVMWGAPSMPYGASGGWSWNS